MQQLSSQHEKSSGKTLEGLINFRQRLLPILVCLPGAKSVAAFGSTVEDRADGYSDLDLILATDDLPATRSSLLDSLEALGPVEFCWAISLRKDEWNPTIVFRDEGYYHKLDIGLVSTEASEPTIPLEQTVPLIATEKVQRCYAVRSSEAYVPAYGSVGHFLLGQFLGATRYVKARKRNQPMTCYRFATAAAEWCARALYARLTSDLNLASKLSTDEYRRLDALAPPNERESLLGALDFSSPAAMDRAMYVTLANLLTNGSAIAIANNESIPAHVFERMLAWVQTELAVGRIN